MILGRTPEGLIKIKKDEPLGLRAVNCACCVPVECGCRSVFAPSNITNILNNVTTASQCTLLGQEPTYFFQDETGFNAEWSEAGSYIYSVIDYNVGSPCLFMVFSDGNESGISIMYGGSFGEPPCNGISLTNFQINGVTLTSFYEQIDPGAPTTTPIFVFT